MIQATFTRTLTIYVVRFCFNLHVIWLFYVACLCAGFFALNTAPLFGSFAVDAGPRCTSPCASGSWSNCWRFSRRWCQTWWHGTIWPVCVVRSFRAIGFFCLSRYYFVFLSSPKLLQVVAAAVALCYRVRNPEFLRHVLLIWLHSESCQQSSVSTVAKSGNLAEGLDSVWILWREWSPRGTCLKKKFEVYPFFDWSQTLPWGSLVPVGVILLLPYCGRWKTLLRETRLETLISQGNPMARGWLTMFFFRWQCAHVLDGSRLLV